MKIFVGWRLGGVPGGWIAGGSSKGVVNVDSARGS